MLHNFGASVFGANVIWNMFTLPSSAEDLRLQ